MTIEMTNFSYTQEKMDSIITNFLTISDRPLKFESNYGCGEMLDSFPNQVADWDLLKEELFSEYDNLWKELANR